MDLAFDGMEELAWATKAVVWRYCSGKFGVPISAVTDKEVRSVMELEGGKVQDSPFSGMSFESWEFDAFIASFHIATPMNFHITEDLEEAALITFVPIRTFARYLLSSSTPGSGSLDLRRVTSAIEDVFARRAYWRRLWIIQEVLCASEVIIMCGHRLIDLDVCRLILLVSDFRPYTADGSSMLLKPLEREDISLLTSVTANAIFMALEGVKYRGQQLPSLAKAIYSYTWKLCSDPRDNIYALLSIRNPGNMLIDYSVPISHVFTLATREIIRQEGTLDFILMRPFDADANLKGNVDMPSWVPRFHNSLSTRRLIKFQPAEDAPLYDAGGLLDRFDVFQTHESLEVHMYLSEEVSHVYPLKSPSTPRTKYIWNVIDIIVQHQGLDGKLHSQSLYRTAINEPAKI